MKYFRYLILFIGTSLSALAGIFAGLWSTIQIVGVFYLWITVIIGFLISAVFAFGGYKLTGKLIPRRV
jgi:hypothetical protein